MAEVSDSSESTMHGDFDTVSSGGEEESFTPVVYGKRALSGSSSGENTNPRKQRLLRSPVPAKSYALKVSATDATIKLARQNQVIVGKHLSSVLGATPLKSLTWTRDGHMILTPSDVNQYNILRKLTTLGPWDVSVSPLSPPKVLGVIYGVSLDTSEEELLDALKSSGVIAAQRLTKRVDGEVTTSSCVKLSFSLSALPTSVHLGYMSFSVRQFVPTAIQCFKCRRFGHVAGECKSHQRCARCGQNHQTSECKLESREHYKCVNCGGNHSAAFGGCVKRKEAQQIIKVAVVENIPRSEARKKVATVSYASVVKAKESLVEQSATVPKTATSLPTGSISPRPKMVTIGTQTVECIATQTDSPAEITPFSIFNSMEAFSVFLINCLEALRSNPDANVAKAVKREMKRMETVATSKVTVSKPKPPSGNKNGNNGSP